MHKIGFVQTLGEYEAFVSAVNNTAGTNIILTTRMEFVKEFQEDIKYIEEVSGEKCRIYYARFRYIWLCALALRMLGGKTVATLNLFDPRHNIMKRLLCKCAFKYVVRDSIEPHDTPIVVKNQVPIMLIESHIDRASYSNLRCIINSKSTYTQKLHKSLMDKSKSAAQNIFIVSKNTFDGGDQKKLEYIRAVLDCADPEDRVYVRAHPREDVSILKAISGLNIVTAQGLYQQIKTSKYVVVLGGSTGWLTRVLNNILYVDDPVFNRGRTTQRIFNIDATVNSPMELRLKIKEGKF